MMSQNDDVITSHVPVSYVLMGRFAHKHWSNGSLNNNARYFVTFSLTIGVHLISGLFSFAATAFTGNVNNTNNTNNMKWA